MAFFIAKLRWHGRGITPVLVTIIAADLFWIVPFAISRLTPHPSAYSLCFGNWLVSAFAVIILCQTAQRIPRQLEDSARLDGLGWFATYWHALLPLAKRELEFLALLIVMATALPYWGDIVTESLHTPFGPFFAMLRLPTYDSMFGRLVESAVITLPVIGIFFLAKRQLTQRADDWDL